jgi:hypothetical protein
MMCLLINAASVNVQLPRPRPSDDTSETAVLSVVHKHLSVRITQTIW